MLDKLKQLFFNKKQNEEEKIKTIVICIHGFGRRQQHEYDNFKLWNQDKFKFKTFNIYNLEDNNDNNPTIWIRRCEGMVESYIKAGYEVSLIGFSMGGVLATHLASKYKIHKLFLISSAFDYLHVGSLVNSAVNKFKKPIKYTNQVILPASFTPAFLEVVRLCKDDISKITCPVIFIHGDKDETIPPRSSINAFEKVTHEQKRLFIIHNGKHRMMLHDNSAWETWKLFNLFMDGELLPETLPEYAIDLFEEIKCEEKDN